MPSHQDHNRMRSQSRSANSPPVLVEGGDGIDGRQLLEEITQQYNRNYVDQPDFQERMMMSYYAAPRAPDVPRSAPNMNPRYSSSMSPSYTASRSSSRSIPGQYSVRYPPSQSSASSQRSRAPSLTSDTTAATRSSVVTWDRQAEYIARSGPFDADGVVRSGNIPCDFDFLLCTRTSPVGSWHDHSRSHLGPLAPPTSVSCPARDCDWSTVRSNGEQAWLDRSTHIENEHASPSCWNNGWRRPDRALIQHLWDRNITLPEEHRDLTVYGRLRSSSYSVNHGRRDDRRREPRHHGRRPQG